MYEVTTDGHTAEMTKEEFLRVYGLSDKAELYKTPFTKHVLIRDGKTITVTLKEK